MIITVCSLFSLSIQAQSPAPPVDSIPFFTLGQCIDYAFKHQPTVQQALINEQVTRTSNAISLAGWYPQANINGNLTHYMQLPTVFVKNANGIVQQQKSGVVNTAVPVLSVTQSIFSPALAYAIKAAPLYVQQAEQITDSARIDMVVAVSKSFYSLLLTLEQIRVLKEDTARLNKNYSDSYHQFVAGLVDRTDYEQATITLNNTLAQLRTATENVSPQYAILKQTMGYPPQSQFNVIFDTVQMKQDIAFDTTQQLDFNKRVEYNLLQTSRNLQHQTTNYYRLDFLPTLSAFFSYDYEFQNNEFSQLFANAYPYSYVGLSLSLPIFTGFSRLNNIKRSRLLERELDWSELGLKSQIYTEYTTALATYKSNLYNLSVMGDNAALARDVYEIVTLQYQQGIVPYLNVITAESNLISSEIGYSNALFTVLSNKVDLEKAMGIVSYHH